MEFVKPSKQATLNVLLYGPAKTGKTMGAASAPGPVLYLNADRPNATRLAHQVYGDKIQEVRIEGLDTLIDAAVAVNDDGEYQTVVLDTYGEAYRILLEEMSGRALSPKIQEYGDVGTHMERFARAMCERSDVNFVIAAHEIALPAEGEEYLTRLPFTGTKGGTPVAAEKLMAMVDVIGYTGVAPQEEGDDKYVAQLVDANGRRGGDRFGVLGKVREVDLTEWVDLATNNTTKKKEAVAA